MADVILVYLSKAGNTRRIAEAIAEGARSAGLSAEAVELYDIRPEVVMRSKVVAIGSPTYEQDMLAPIAKFLEGLKEHMCLGKLGIAFGSYGWSGEAPLFIARKMRELGFHIMDPVVRIQYDPDDKELESCMLLGKDIAQKLKSLNRVRVEQ